MTNIAFLSSTSRNRYMLALASCDAEFEIYHGAHKGNHAASKPDNQGVGDAIGVIERYIVDHVDIRA